ncbi:MAG: leucyl/phenylalanyl-tRNA--protein transferase [Acidimicrobiia bacterium]
MSQPIEPPPSRFELPDPRWAGVDDVIAIGGDLAPGTVLSAYRKGLFPMHLPDGPLAWWSPWQRGVLPLDGLRVSRSLRRSIDRYRCTVDLAFAAVVEGCADPGRPHGWITDDITAAYGELHRLGWAHSVEAWDDHGELVGGLYGIAIGGLFAGESMFHRAADASKVALVGLVERVRAGGGILLDVQWATDHLVSLGVVEIGRLDYLNRLERALAVPAIDWDGPGRRPEG